MLLILINFLQNVIRRDKKSLKSREIKAQFALNDWFFFSLLF